MASYGVTGLRTSYLTGDVVTVRHLPAGATRAVAYSAWGRAYEAQITSEGASFSSLPEGTHAVAVLDANANVLVEDFTTVRHTAGVDPIMGFVTSFDDDSREEVLSWLHDLRCTVVQVYDWMDSYSVPLASTPSYQDPLGRRVDLEDLRRLITGIKDQGAIAQAYAPVCAADVDVADAQPTWRLFRNDGNAESLGDLLQVMNPGAEGWQNYWIDQYSRAVNELGFDGFHLDTYGYPRAALDDSGEPVALEASYASFIEAVRRARPNDVVSFNQVNGVPRGLTPPTGPSFRYVEVWPPNTKWRHLESLLHRSAGTAPPLGDTLAIYPAVWHLDNELALRTVLISQAILTTLGANALIWGDRHGVLCHPYYVDHHDLSGDDVVTVLEWHRFGLRCRDLFKSGRDTSWYELEDENAAVVVVDETSARPEPIAGSLYVRTRRDDHQMVISVMDLGGSVDGSWSSGTAAGVRAYADVVVLLERPEDWRIDVAVLGRDDGRFGNVSTEWREMREGRGIMCRVPLEGGWSVLRLVQGEPE